MEGTPRPPLDDEMEVDNNYSDDDPADNSSDNEDVAEEESEDDFEEYEGDLNRGLDEEEVCFFCKKDCNFY